MQKGTSIHAQKSQTSTWTTCPLHVRGNPVDWDIYGVKKRLDSGVGVEEGQTLQADALIGVLPVPNVIHTYT